MELGSREDMERYDVYKPEKAAGKLSYGRPIVTIMVGLPGSGKSTFAKDLIYDGVVYISSDEIRDEFFNGEYGKEQNNEVFRIVMERYEKALQEGKDVVLDATHLLEKYRRKYIEKAKEYNGYLIAIYIGVSYTVAYERNLKRDRQVPKDVIRRMFFDLEPPSHKEGFDEICIVDENGDVEFT